MSLKYNKYTVVVICALASAHTSIFALTNQIDFRTALDLALSANYKMQASNYQTDAATATLKQARGGGLPSLNLEANAARSNNPSNVFGYKLAQRNATFADFGADEYRGQDSMFIAPQKLNYPGYYNNFNTGVALNIPIFLGGKTKAKTKASKALLQASSNDTKTTKNALTYELLQSYEGARLATSLLDLAKESANATSNYFDTTQALYKQSLAQQSDVILAETSLRSTKTALKSAEFELQNQLDLFHEVLGQPNSKVIPGEAVKLKTPELSERALQQQALLANPSLLAMEAHLAATRSYINVAKAGNLPELNLQLRHDWNANVPQLNNSSNTAMLQMNWKLFSSGAQSGATQLATAEYNQATAELNGAKNHLQVEVGKSLRDLSSAKMQEELNLQNAVAMQKVVNQIIERYGRGSAMLSQLLDAQARLDAAKRDSAISHYNVVLAQARVLALIGSLSVSYE